MLMALSPEVTTTTMVPTTQAVTVDTHQPHPQATVFHLPQPTGLLLLQPTVQLLPLPTAQPPLLPQHTALLLLQPQLTAHPLDRTTHNPVTITKVTEWVESHRLLRNTLFL